MKKISAPGKAGAREAVQFLLELEKINRNKLKRVILDCPADMAKARRRRLNSISRQLIKHVSF